MSATNRVLLFLISTGIFAQCAIAQLATNDTLESSSFEGLVDVGGRRLHIRCTGRNTEGSPTIVLESGLGDPSSVWNRVQPEVAKFTRACSYDRPGLGGSEPALVPRTIEAVVAGLLALLMNAKVPSPYILVGHSLGEY